MPATYDASLATDKDWVRLLSGDRDTTKAVLQDEEIAGLLQENQNKYLAAAMACEMVIARTKGLVDKQVGDLRLKYAGSAQDAYRKYIQYLREKGAGLTHAKPAVFRVL